MSDTHRNHMPKGRAAKLGGQPRTRSLSARAAWERGGAGIHGLKTNKQRRAAERRALRKEEF